MLNKRLTILHTESSKGWGGQEIRILQEAIGIRKRGHRVLIATPSDSQLYVKAKENDFTVYTIEFSKKSLKDFFELARIVDRERVDILNTHSSSDSWVATIGAKISKRKPRIIRTRHLSTPISKTFLSRLIYNILPDAIITTGEEIKKQMITINRFNEKKIYSIPTGIDLHRFDPETVKPVITGSSVRIGMVSVLRSWKGHEYFIKAVPLVLKEVPEAEFYIVGDGPQYNNIKKLISNASLNGKVKMLGHRDDVPEIMASLDILVHPSYANEGVPQSILQAMAMKKPVVASDAGSIKEVVKDGITGFLVSPRDPVGLARKIVLLIRRPELRKKFGDEGRRMIENKYSIQKMLDDIEALYKEVFNGL